jgi:elongation factor P hydroxylase
MRIHIMLDSYSGHFLKMSGRDESILRPVQDNLTHLSIFHEHGLYGTVVL